MPDVAGELRDEEEVSLGPQGPGGGGVGLGDRDSQGLMVRVDNKPPPLDVVLELLDRGRDGQELPIEGGVPGLGSESRRLKKESGLSLPR